MKYIAILDDEHIVRVGDKPCLHCFNGLMEDYFIPVKEQKVSKWIEDGYYDLPCVCSYCGHEGKYDMKYCPNCGSHMRNEK